MGFQKLKSNVNRAISAEIVFTTSENKNREFVEKVMLLKGVKEVLSENL